MSRTASYGYAEFEDTTLSYEDVRITLASKIAFERFARANKVDHETQPFTTESFLSWHAAKTAGKPAGSLKFEDFLARAIDAGIDSPEEPRPGDEADPDPTQTAASTGSPSD